MVGVTENAILRVRCHCDALFKKYLFFADVIGEENFTVITHFNGIHTTYFYLNAGWVKKFEKCLDHI